MSGPAGDGFGDLCYLPNTAGLRYNQVGPSGLWRDVLAVHRLDRSPELFLYRCAGATALGYVPVQAPLEAALPGGIEENAEVEEWPQLTAMQEPEPLNKQNGFGFDEAVLRSATVGTEIISGHVRRSSATQGPKGSA